MSLKLNAIYRVPEQTAQVAQAAFPTGSLCMRIHDELGTIFQDEDFSDLFSHRGQPAESPMRLALITILQFVEVLSDRSAADAVRARIDWKYLLCLDLTDPGFDHTVLSEFRSRLLKAGKEHLMFDKLLIRLRERGILKSGGQQRTDSTHILGVIRAMNRIECVVETMRYALNSLSVVVPEWTRKHGGEEWIERYGHRAEDNRLPKTKAKREDYAEVVGADGWELLSSIFSNDAPPWLSQIPAVDILRRVWIQQYIYDNGKIRWRDASNIPPSAVMISSPYDIQAHYACKNSTSWVGYKVHLTETCDTDNLHFITNVETTASLVTDSDAVVLIHESLMKKDLLPDTHLVDTGYVEAKLLVKIPDQYGVDLFGPTRNDYHWQSKAGLGFDAGSFQIDWNKQEATCPEGKKSLNWTQATDRGDNAVIKIKFSRKDCKPCSSRSLCTTGKKLRRTITIRPQENYQALRVARQRQKTEEFKQLYKKRSGIEGTISQAVRAFGMRRSRYIGIKKTHLQHVLTAVAINLVRLNEWLIGSPMAMTRISQFERLMMLPLPT